jgi:hypothetical protein
MVSSIADRIFSQQFSAITLQVSILTVDAYLVSANKGNLFVYLSAIAVASLFALQASSRRFLWFYPSFGKIPTPSADTYILRVFVAASLLFLLIGAAGRWPDGSVAEKPECLILSWAAVALIFIFPVLWNLIGIPLVRNHVEKMIKAETRPVRELCPISNGPPHSRIRKTTVVSKTRAEHTVTCEECGYEYSESKPITIAY